MDYIIYNDNGIDKKLYQDDNYFIREVGTKILYRKALCLMNSTAEFEVTDIPLAATKEELIARIEKEKENENT